MLIKRPSGIEAAVVSVVDTNNEMNPWSRNRTFHAASSFNSAC
jgi:hypothetical protein